MYVDFSAVVDSPLLVGLSREVVQSIHLFQQEDFKLRGIAQGPRKIRLSCRNRFETAQSEHEVRGSARHWIRSAKAEELLPSLGKILEASAVFAEVGRILLIWSDGPETPEHTDHDIPTLEQHFLWLNPAGGRRLYLRDSSGNLIVPSSRVLWFDSSLRHGTAGSTVPSFSIRIDGLFLPRAAEIIRRRAMDQGE